MIPPGRARVLLIGLDSADGEILLRMSQAGRLPTIARLLREGAQAQTINPVGLYVGALWSSFSTGTSPASHGRHSPRQLVPGTYDTRPLTPEQVRRPPFWLALGEAGRRCAIIDVPHSHTIARAGGVQIVEWGCHDPACGFTTWPPALADDVLARVGSHPVHPTMEQHCDVPDRTADDYVALRDALLDGVARRTELSLHLLEQGGWDLFLTVFSESHCANHQCWHLRDPAHPRHDAETARRTGDVIETVYEALDAAVARLLAHAGDDTTVLVLASHGAAPHYDGSFLLDRILRRLDRRNRPWHRRWAERAFEAYWRRLPSDRQWRHPHARDRLWRGYEDLAPLDPGSRRWFKIDNNEPYGAVRFNLQGREPRGVVLPGAELDACREQLCRDLLEIVNLDTGRPLARRVVRTAEVHHGENLDLLPDLLIEWEREAPVRSVGSPKIGRIDAEYTGIRTGDHRAPGMLIARGPGIAPGILPAIAVEDIAPTVAALLGVELTGVDGRVVDALARRAPAAAPAT